MLGLKEVQRFTMPRSRPEYPPDFRQKMVELARAGRNPEELAFSANQR